MVEEFGGVRALEEALAEHVLEQEAEQVERKPRPDKLAKRRLTKEQAEAMASGLEEYDGKIVGGRLVGG